MAKKETVAKKTTARHQVKSLVGLLDDIQAVCEKSIDNVDILVNGDAYEIEPDYDTYTQGWKEAFEKIVAYIIEKKLQLK